MKSNRRIKKIHLFHYVFLITSIIKYIILFNICHKIGFHSYIHNIGYTFIFCYVMNKEDFDRVLQKLAFKFLYDTSYENIFQKIEIMLHQSVNYAILNNRDKHQIDYTLSGIKSQCKEPLFEQMYKDIYAMICFILIWIMANNTIF